MQGKVGRFPTLVYIVLTCPQVPSGELGWSWPTETAVGHPHRPGERRGGRAARRKGLRRLQPLVLLDVESGFGVFPLDFCFTPYRSHSPPLQVPVFALGIPKPAELANTEAVVVQLLNVADSLRPRGL